MKHITAQEVARHIIYNNVALEMVPGDSTKAEYYLHITDDGELTCYYDEADESFTVIADISEWADDETPDRLYEEFERTDNADFMEVCRNLAEQANEYLESIEEE